MGKMQSSANSLHVPSARLEPLYHSLPLSQSGPPFVIMSWACCAQVWLYSVMALHGR